MTYDISYICILIKIDIIYMHINKNDIFIYHKIKYTYLYDTSYYA